MDFAFSERSQALQAQVTAFLAEHVYPAEQLFEQQVAANRAAGTPFRTPAVLAGLKDEARRDCGISSFRTRPTVPGCRCSTTRRSPSCPADRQRSRRKR
jgi:hypothetical protein